MNNEHKEANRLSSQSLLLHRVIVLFDGRNMSNIKYSNQKTYLNPSAKKLQNVKKMRCKTELNRIKPNWNQRPKRVQIKSWNENLCAKKKTHRFSFVMSCICMCCRWLSLSPSLYLFFSQQNNILSIRLCFPYRLDKQTLRAGLEICLVSHI